MERIAYQKFHEVDRRHFWKRGRRRLILEWLARYRPQNKKLRILDIGGACSIVSSQMRRFGEVTVVEPDAEAIEEGRRLFGLDIRQGRLPDGLPVTFAPDVVTLLDVLEHVDDDLAALEAVLKILKPGGLLLCTVPAVDWLWSELDVVLHHRRRYSRSSLAALLAKAGFSIQRESYYTSLLFPFTALHRLAKRLFPAKRAPRYDVLIESRLANAFLGGIMTLERLILRLLDLPFGSSLIAVAFKPYGQGPGPSLSYSVVMPVYNEEASLAPLFAALRDTMQGLNASWEAVFVNDCSRDASLEVLKNIEAPPGTLCIIDLCRHYGKSAALQAGFDRARGKVIITMDSDLQHDPQDIPLLLEKLREGFDVVCGWRYRRQDPWHKIISSHVACSIRRAIFRERIRDLGSAFRAFDRRVLERVHLYGGLHRFFSLIVARSGFRVAEVRVQHHRRRFGRTKYNIHNRLLEGAFDLAAIAALDMRALMRPRHTYEIREILEK